MTLTLYCFKKFLNFSGDESYENYKKFALDVFTQLEDLNNNGFNIDGVHHKMDIKCTCDWKASSCIEGLVSPTGRYFCKFCLCRKEDINDLSGKYPMIIYLS